MYLVDFFIKLNSYNVFFNIWVNYFLVSMFDIKGEIKFMILIYEKIKRYIKHYFSHYIYFFEV